MNVSALIILGLLGSGLAIYSQGSSEAASTYEPGPEEDNDASKTIEQSTPQSEVSLAADALLLFGFSRNKFIIVASIISFVGLAIIAASVTLSVLYQSGYFNSELSVSDMEHLEDLMSKMDEEEQRRLEIEKWNKEQAEEFEKTKNETCEMVIARHQQRIPFISIVCGCAAFLAAVITVVLWSDKIRGIMGKAAQFLKFITGLCVLGCAIAISVTDHEVGALSFIFSLLAGSLIGASILGFLGHQLTAEAQRALNHMIGNSDTINPKWAGVLLILGLIVGGVIVVPIVLYG